MSADQDKKARQPRANDAARQRYQQPRLERLGDLRGLTLGSSPGIPDSGIGMPEQAQP